MIQPSMLRAILPRQTSPTVGATLRLRSGHALVASQVAKIATTICAVRSVSFQSLAVPAMFALAAVIRLALISGFRFHPDEALYATWARLVATGQDVWLATRVVDKPPLFIYTLAALFSTLGASEEIARLPNEL